MTIRLLNNLIKVPLSAVLVLILIGSVIANSNIFSVHSQSVPTASPSLPLSSIFDIPNMKIISSNATGYEAEAPLKNSFSGLV